MTLNFTRSELVPAINVLTPYLVSKGAISLRVEKGTLDLFACAAIEGGSVLVRVPCNKTAKPVPWMHVDGITLQQAIQLADEGTITLDFATDKLTLKYPGSTFELRALLTPPITPEKVEFGKTTGHIKGRDVNLLSTMTEAASTEEARPALTGIYLAASKKKLEAAAADGFILACATLALDASDATGATYSVKALNRAKRALKAGDDEEIAIGFNSHSITLSAQRYSAEITIDIPHVGGTFPDYKPLLGGDKETIVEVESKALGAFLKRSAAIQSGIFMQARGGFLWLLTQNELTREKCLDSIPVEEAQGESACMLYAHDLLKNALKACVPNGKVTLSFPQTNKSPMTLGGAATVLAMPLINPLDESPFKGMQPTLM